MRKRLVLVVPCFNENDGLAKFVSEVDGVMHEVADYDLRFLFVNDGSSDDSFVHLKALAASDPRISVLDLSRNFGKEIALSAGLHEISDFDVAVTMDADLQHPPSALPLMIGEWESGSEMVIGIRDFTQNKPLLRRFFSRMFYLVMSKISEVNVVENSTDFRLYDRKVVNEFRKCQERNRMFRGVMDWLGFRRSYVHFQSPGRGHGAAKFSFFMLTRLAVTGIASSSLIPLQIAGYLGFVMVALSGFALIFALVRFYLFDVLFFSGIAMLALVNTFLIGVVLVSIGLVAIYIGRINLEVARRPLYVVREKIN